MNGPFEKSQRFMTMGVESELSRINLYFGSYVNSIYLTTTFQIVKNTSFTNSFNLSSTIDNVPILLSIRLKTDGILNAKFNGKLLTATTPTKISSPLELGKTFVPIIGWSDDSQSPQLHLSEMIFYNSGLKNEEILYVEKYLSKKWGIALK